jgi:hypothetical protein
MANAYDDLPPIQPAAATAVPVPIATQTANVYDDITPPPKPRQSDLPPVTATNRVHALEGGILGGTAYLAALPLDTAANVYNLGKAGLGAGYQAITGKPGWDVGGPSPVGHWLTEQMDKNPVTSTQPERPDDAASRYLATAGSVVPGAAAAGGGAVAPAVKALAAALPSATAGQAVMEAHPFQSDDANRTASMLTQALTSVGTPYAAKAVIRGVAPTAAGIATGAAPDVMGENIAAFNNANADPSLAQAAGTRRMQFLESGLSKIPGGAGVMQKAATQQAADLRGGVDQTIDHLAPGGVSPERAGRAISQGITGPGGFKDAFNTKAGQLYDAVDQHIAPDSLVDVSNTLATLDRVAMPNPLAPKTTAALINPKVAAIRDALHSDLGIGQPAASPGAGESGPAAGSPANTKLPYSTLADLRSRVGSMLTGSELVTDIPRAQVKQLYGGLSDDLRGAAQAAGPDAVQAFSRANNYYRAGMGRMDTLSNVLDKNGGPEQIFNGAMAGTKDGATRLRSVMQSLQPEQQQVVASTVFNRMGQATAGNQNAAGDVFSPETFLTNYNRMSPEAKSALFDRVPALRDQADNLAEVAQNLREGSRVFKNASGTAGGENQTNTIHNALLLALGAGGGEGYHALGPKGVALAAAIPAAAYGGARAMTSPSVVNWAANPAVGSSAQAASLTAAVANASEQERNRQRLMNSLIHVNSPN